jgi:hypothetical protein
MLQNDAAVGHQALELVAGKGHWLSGTAIIAAAYAMSLLFTERLSRLVKPQLLMLNWFAVLWSNVTSVWNTLQIMIGTEEKALRTTKGTQ